MSTKPPLMATVFPNNATLTASAGGAIAKTLPAVFDNPSKPTDNPTAFPFPPPHAAPQHQRNQQQKQPVQLLGKRPHVTQYSNTTGDTVGMNTVAATAAVLLPDNPHKGRSRDVFNGNI